VVCKPIKALVYGDEVNLDIRITAKTANDDATKRGFTVDWENMAEKLLLVHSEISEATEAHRVDDMEHFMEEIADTVIRLFHIGHYMTTQGFDLEDAIAKKMQTNRGRPWLHGKRY